MYRFTVRGHGRFPLDMLRYDSCWPATQEDARLIEATMERLQGVRIEPREIQLDSESASPITVDRWASFGWSVTVI